MKLVGERRALAASVMAFYTLLYGLVALSDVVPDFGRAFAALAGVYGLAFFSLVAGYFWARWYAVGVGLYGVITGVVGIWQLGAEPVLLFVGGTHLAATLLLWGQAMSQPYDGQTEWRQRFHMDENSVQRLGKSVIKAGVSLPFILLYALMPRPEGASMLAPLVALALAGLGFRAVVRLRTWGVMALGAAGVLMLSLATADVATAGLSTAVMKPAIAGALLIAAAVPFLAPMIRWLRRAPTSV
jgi:hypothetical protein